MKTIEGSHEAAGLRFGLVVSKFNEFVTDRLLSAAHDVLMKAGAADDAVTVVRVPGAFEIPLVARRLAESGRYDAVLCLGAVVKGETPHFDYISAEVSRGIAQAAWISGIPVIFGVLTTNSVDQALARAGAPERNRGAEAARTAIEMATLMKRLGLAGARGAGRKASHKGLGRRRGKRSR